MTLYSAAATAVSTIDESFNISSIAVTAEQQFTAAAVSTAATAEQRTTDESFDTAEEYVLCTV